MLLWIYTRIRLFPKQPPTTNHQPPHQPHQPHQPQQPSVAILAQGLSLLLMGRSNKQNLTLPPAPVVEYIAPAPVVSPEGNFFAPAPAEYAAPAPVEKYIAPAPAVHAAQAPVEKYIAPAPAVHAAQAPVVEYFAPVPAVYQAPTPVVVSIAQCHAPVFPLSLRMHRTRLCLKTCTRAPGSRCQCPSKLVLRRSVRRPIIKDFRRSAETGW